MTKSYISLACASLISLGLTACGKASVTDLNIKSSRISSQSCSGDFKADVDIENPENDDVEGTANILNRVNVQNTSVTPRGKVVFDAGRTEILRFDGELKNTCEDGLVQFTISQSVNGRNKSTGLKDVDVDAVITGKNADAGTLADPISGRFSYDAVYTCCGVGFANNYDLTALAENTNVTNLAVTPDTFMCDRLEDHTVIVTGELVNKTRGGAVRVKIKDRPRGFSCSLLQDVTPNSEDG